MDPIQLNVIAVIRHHAGPDGWMIIDKAKVFHSLVDVMPRELVIFQTKLTDAGQKIAETMAWT